MSDSHIQAPTVLAAEHGLFVGALFALTAACACVAVWIHPVCLGVPVLLVAQLFLLVHLHRLRLRRGIKHMAAYSLWLMLFASLVTIMFTYCLIWLVGSDVIATHLTATMVRHWHPELGDARVVASLYGLICFLVGLVILTPIASSIASAYAKRDTSIIDTDTYNT